MNALIRIVWSQHCSRSNVFGVPSRHSVIHILVQKKCLLKKISKLWSETLHVHTCSMTGKINIGLLISLSNKIIHSFLDIMIVVTDTTCYQNYKIQLTILTWHFPLFAHYIFKILLDFIFLSLIILFRYDVSINLHKE